MKERFNKIRKVISEIIDVNVPGFKITSALYLLFILSLIILILLPFAMPDSKDPFIMWLKQQEDMFLWIFLADLIIKIATTDIRQPKLIKKYGHWAYILPTSWWTALDGIVFLAWIPGLQFFILFKALTLIKIVKLFPRVNNALAFIVKGLLRERRGILTILIILSLIIVVGGFMFFTLELSVNPDVNNIWDALWFSFISATTIGYGDITPVTAGGRIIAMVFSVVGIINIAILSGVAIFGIQTEARTQRLKIQKAGFQNDPTFKTAEFDFWLKNQINDKIKSQFDDNVKKVKKAPSKKKKEKVSTLTSKI